MGFNLWGKCSKFILSFTVMKVHRTLHELYTPRGVFLSTMCPYEGRATSVYTQPILVDFMAYIPIFSTPATPIYQQVCPQDFTHAQVRVQEKTQRCRRIIKLHLHSEFPELCSLSDDKSISFIVSICQSRQSESTVW